MGKIYDALKKAEQDALLHKKDDRAQTDIQEIVRPVSTSVGTIPIENTLHLKKKDDDKSYLPEKRKKVLSRKADESLVVLHQPNSFISEQFKNLRARLLPLTKNGKLRTILVTSSLAKEGKSTVASNLAISIAQAFDEQVFLIDTDLRNPSIKNLFALNPGEGLVDFIGNEHSLSEVVHKTNIHNLSILPTGIIPANPSALISSEKMKQLIPEIKSHYHNPLVIIDSSPVQQTTEPRIIAEEVDGILLVVRAGRTNRELIKETVNILGKDKILGIVFNGSSEQNKSYYTDYYYTR